MSNEYFQFSVLVERGDRRDLSIIAAAAAAAAAEGSSRSHGFVQILGIDNKWMPLQQNQEVCGIDTHRKILSMRSLLGTSGNIQIGIRGNNTDQMEGDTWIARITLHGTPFSSSYSPPSSIEAQPLNGQLCTVTELHRDPPQFEIRIMSGSNDASAQARADPRSVAVVLNPMTSDGAADAIIRVLRNRYSGLNFERVQDPKLRYKLLLYIFETPSPRAEAYLNANLANRVTKCAEKSIAIVVYCALNEDSFENTDHSYFFSQYGFSNSTTLFVYPRDNSGREYDLIQNRTTKRAFEDLKIELEILAPRQRAHSRNRIHQRQNERPSYCRFM